MPLLGATFKLETTRFEDLSAFHVCLTLLLIWVLLFCVAIRLRFFSLIHGVYDFFFSPLCDFSVRENCPKKQDVLGFCLWNIPTCFFRRSPDVYIFGASKSGTSFLSNVLCQHPDIMEPIIAKESHFFNGLSVFGYRFEDCDHLFRAFFPSIFSKFWNPQSKVIESTPNYIYWNEVTSGMIVKRILKQNPNAKFIVVLREPIKRAHSQWGMVRQGKDKMYTEHREKRGFHEAMNADTKTVQNVMIRRKISQTKSMAPLFHHHDQEGARRFVQCRYIRGSNYNKQMKCLYASEIPPGNILAFGFQDVTRDPQGVASLIFEELGLRPFVVEDTQPKNQTSYKKSDMISSETYRLLKKELAEDIRFFNNFSSTKISKIHAQRA